MATIQINEKTRGTISYGPFSRKKRSGCIQINCYTTKVCTVQAGEYPVIRESKDHVVIRGTAELKKPLYLEFEYDGPGMPGYDMTRVEDGSIRVLKSDLGK